jgi:hypothetical protein
VAGAGTVSDHVRAVVAHYAERAATYGESAMHRRLAEFVADWIELGLAPHPTA